MNQSGIMSRIGTVLSMGLCAALIAVALVVAGCISPFSGGAPPTPPVTPAPSSCGFTTCHGLDLACSSDAPEVCDLSYRLGDKCRQYARCDASGGSCMLVTDPQFASCKACVERCAAIKSTTVDPAMVFECEAQC